MRPRYPHNPALAEPLGGDGEPARWREDEVTKAEGLTPEQRKLWDFYAPARERVLASGRPNATAEAVAGFIGICRMEGVPAPSEAAVRAELG